ncbi:MAG: folate-binding protein [Pseudomonadota bacterium]
MDERIILAIGGADREAFLQGLVTNDVSLATSGIVYAALLTPQGKYLSDFFLRAQDEEILLDVAESQAQALAQRLSMYKLRADVAITVSPLKVSIGTGPAPAGADRDPRHPDLGWRLYGEAATSDGTDYDAIRVAHCIPAAGVELISNDTFVLEAGFERLNGVDFRKGCYVGQEVTARMKHKTSLRKGFATVNVAGEAPVGTEITSEGKPAGTLYTQSGGRGIAYLRFDRAEGPMQAGTAAVTYP